MLLTKLFISALPVLAISAVSATNLNPVTGLDHSVMPKVKEISAPKSVLFVGNSFMYYNNGVSAYVNNLAKASKIPFRSTMVTISGSGLDWHLVKSYLREENGLASYRFVKNKVIPIDLTKEKRYDIVLMNGNSQGPIADGLSQNFRKFADIHSNDVRAAGSTPAIMMTWAYKDRPEMTRALADATIEQANKSNVMVVPVGLAFAKATENRPEIVLHSPDKRHPSVAGTYLEAAVIYSSLFHKNPTGLTFKPVGEAKTLDPETVKYLQEIAWSTVTSFFGWKK